MCVCVFMSARDMAKGSNNHSIAPLLNTMNALIKIGLL